MLKRLLAENILRARKEVGISQKELGTRVGVHQNVVCRWEQAKAAPELDNVELIAQALKKDPTWFFNRHSEAIAVAHKLPEPPPGTPPELAAWIMESFRAARDPLTQIHKVEEVSATCLTMPVIVEVADLTELPTTLLEDEEQAPEDPLKSLHQSLPPGDLSIIQFFAPI